MSKFLFGYLNRKMKKWSKYPISIRASVIGSFITITGTLIIAVLTHTNASQEKIIQTEKTTQIEITKPKVNSDSIKLIEKVKYYYKFNTINVEKLERFDLDKNGVNDEFFIVYQADGDEFTYSFDVFTIRDSSIHILYHAVDPCDCIDYDFIKGENHNYLLKTWKDGSGGYLSLEIYKYTDQTRLTKIYSTPDNLDTFQGHYMRIDNKMYLILANKRYNLEIGSNDKVTLIPYTKRLRTSDMQNSEHVLRFDENSHNLVITFDSKRLQFEKSDADTYTSRDTILLYLNDICWIDDNSIVPVGIRFFYDKHFEQNFSLFDNFISKKPGFFTYDFINKGYGDAYRIKFKILKSIRDLE